MSPPARPQSVQEALASVLAMVDEFTATGRVRLCGHHRRVFDDARRTLELARGPVTLVPRAGRGYSVSSDLDDDVYKTHKVRG